jgi:hypothetical protein
VTCPLKLVQILLLGSGRKKGRMPRIKYTVEQTVNKLREAEVALSK